MMLVGVVSGGEWSQEAIQLLDRLTLCALWKCVMVKREGRPEDRAVRIVDTTTEKVRECVCL